MNSHSPCPNPDEARPWPNIDEARGRADPLAPEGVQSPRTAPGIRAAPVSLRRVTERLFRKGSRVRGRPPLSSRTPIPASLTCCAPAGVEILVPHRAQVWATCPDARFRDARKAVESAERLCKAYERKFPHYVATLAAAGDFDAAVKWQTKANALESDETEEASGSIRGSALRVDAPGSIAGGHRPPLSYGTDPMDRPEQARRTTGPAAVKRSTSPSCFRPFVLS